MKSRNALYLRLVVVLLFFTDIGIQGLQSQTIQSQEKLPILSGSDAKSESVVLKADAIFTGEILQLGPITLSSAGGIGYSANKIKVIQILKGSVDAEVSVAFKLRGSSNEQPPQIGTKYLFFVKKVISPDPDPYLVIKLLPITDDNIAKIKTLIAEASDTKK